MGFVYGPRYHASFRDLMEDYSSDEVSDESGSSQDDAMNPVDATIEAEFHHFIQQQDVVYEVNRPAQGYSRWSDEESVESFPPSQDFSNPNIYDAEDEDSDHEMSDEEAEHGSDWLEIAAQDNVPLESAPLENAPLDSDTSQIDTDCTTEIESCEEK